VTGEERVAVVTGASRGIGKQTCLRLARQGMQLALAARTEEPRSGTPGTLGETVAALRELGCEPLAIRADLSAADDVDRVVSETLARFGGVDVLVNNAAYTVGRTLFTHVPDLTREQWEKHFAVNVTAPLMLIQGFWNSMRARGGGVVVNDERGVDVEPVRNVEALVLFQSSFFTYDRPKTNLDFNIQYYPSLSNAGRQRVQLDAGVKREFFKDLFVALTVYHTYDNRPPNPAADTNDVGVVSSIGWTY